MTEVKDDNPALFSSPSNIEFIDTDLNFTPIISMENDQEKEKVEKTPNAPTKEKKKILPKEQNVGVDVALKQKENIKVNKALKPTENIKVDETLISRENNEVDETLKPKPRSDRFRRLVQSIVTQYVWVREANKTQKKQQDETVSRYTQGDEKLTFNLNAFKAHVQTCGKLSDQAIAILKKQADERNDIEVKIIQKIVYRLKCFDRYPLYVKQELARVIYYDQFDDGRLIIKQGQPGISFYFIVSGNVYVERMEIDRTTKEKHIQGIGELNAGDSFGELALLHNTKRTASIFCKGKSEFLRVDKPDFDEVLRNSHQREWEMRINLLSTHSVFKGWSNQELQTANGHAKIKNYPPNTIILSEKKKRPERVFFLISGKCKVVREISLTKRRISKTKVRYLLPPIERNLLDVKNDQSIAIASKTDQPEKRYLTICELYKGDYFNVGENLDGIYVISVGRVVIMQVGYVAFLRAGDRGRCLEELKRVYLMRIPEKHESCLNYVSDRKWNCYKRNVINEIISTRTRPHRTNFNDVPRVLQKEHMYYMEKEDII